MELQLAGKTALVTGSSSGIGAGIAAGLAHEGCAVVVHGRSTDKVDSVVAAIRAEGGVAQPVMGDLLTDRGAAEVSRLAVEALGRIDILVNNVGGPDTGASGFFDISPMDWAGQFNANAITAVRMIHALVPPMRERGWGRVIQISSRNAISPHANMPSYGASKAAMNNFTLALSKELAFSGVTVNAVMPGLIRTAQLDQFLTDLAQHNGWGDDLARAERHLLSDICRQTVERFGRPEDVAGYVCYLASPRSDFVTGTVLRLDGGSTPTL